MNSQLPLCYHVQSVELAHNEMKTVSGAAIDREAFVLLYTFLKGYSIVPTATRQIRLQRPERGFWNE